MPQYVVDRLERILKRRKKKLEGSNILIAGVAYKKDVKDLRESPAIGIINILQKRRVKVSYSDPLFPYFKINGIDLINTNLTKTTLGHADCVLLIADHTDVDYKFIAKLPDL